MRIAWSRRATRDLDAIRLHIAKDNPRAAQDLADGVFSRVRRLAEYPRSGRPGRIGGTRELVLADAPYIVPYRVQGDLIVILRVYHAARRWPDRL